MFKRVVMVFVSIVTLLTLSSGVAGADVIPEECHHVYKMLKLAVRVHPDERLEVSGALGSDIGVCQNETVSRR